MKKEQLKHIIDVAAGRTPADLVLKNGKIVDVYQKKLLTGDVAIVDGIIAGIGESYQGKESHDLEGKIVSPGLIEPHIHVESSYVTPEEFGQLLARRGTTTAMADPHEIVNVAGMTGLNYMIEAAEETAIDIRYMMPSCVPATHLENAGAVIEAQDMIQPLQTNQTDGLAEFMNFSGVINNDDSVIDKIMVAHQLNKRIDGHSPMISGKPLNAYIAAGINNDHECTTVEELNDRISRGMHVFLREGSVTQNLRALLKGVTEANSRRCVLTGDDLQAKTLVETGHLDNSLRICLEEGISPITAIQMATLNAAEACALSDRGAIAPGLRADIIIFDSLETLNVQQTYVEGQLIAENDQYLLPVKRANTESVQSSVFLKDFNKERLVLPLSSNKVRAIEVVQKEALTNQAILEVKRDVDGNFKYNSEIPVAKIAVVERHRRTGNVFVGLLKDFGIKNGAMAMSIAHDSHNIVVTGTNDDDMEYAVNQLESMQGGVVLVKNKEIIASLPLPIAGIMSDKTTEEVIVLQDKLNKVAFEELGISRNVDPIMTLGFMPLAVIPDLKITDLGLVDVTTFEFVPVSVED